MIFIEPFYLATHIKHYYSLLLNIFLRSYLYIKKDGFVIVLFCKTKLSRKTELKQKHIMSTFPTHTF